MDLYHRIRQHRKYKESLPIDANEIAPGHLRDLYIRQKGICCWCGKFVLTTLATIEHIIPRSRGGKNDLQNKAMAHRHCNNERGSNMNLLPCRDSMFDFVREQLKRYLGR
jgi:5-methylcytosine-specific restriction endonuclease McrA